MEIPEKGPVPPLPVREPATEERSQLPAEPISGEPTIGQRDTVRLTERGREVKTAVDQARSLPEIREARVLELKQQLEKGTYQVEGDRVAIQLIDENLENNSVLKHINTKV